MKIKFKKYDKLLAFCFAFLTLVFLVLALTNKEFFNWAYERHQNQLSWYIRPIFFVPFCYFAYKRSWSGIMATIFCIFTSMFWFPRPEFVSEQVKQFLRFEQDWLMGGMDFPKILMLLLVPISFVALGTAFWKRSLRIGLSVIVLIAIAKMIWSVAFGGQSGKSIFIPAILGLTLCIVLISWGFRKLEKKAKA